MKTILIAIISISLSDLNNNNDIMSNLKAYDTKDKIWRYLNFFEHECHLHAKATRVKLPNGKTKLIKTTWEGLNNGFTLLFEALLLQLCQAMPVNKAAKTIKRHWDGTVKWHESKINNGTLEGLNPVIQAAKSKARGYKIFKNYKIIVYLLTGKLDFSLINNKFREI